ncbi:MAG: FMN-binding protein [Myxococcota bacterium]
MSAALPGQDAPRAWPMYRAMVGVGLFCALSIVTVFQLTRPIIARNRAEALEQAIFQVLPEARSSAAFGLVDGERFERIEGEAKGELVYAGFDEAGALVGLALEARGMGYQDVVHILYGYDPAGQAVIGFRVLESRETPGLGDRIERDDDFLANFTRLDVSVSADGGGIAHPIEAVKHGEKQHPWQVDGITGATISSVAIADMLRASTVRRLPTVRAHLDDFRRPE